MSSVKTTLIVDGLTFRGMGGVRMETSLGGGRRCANKKGGQRRSMGLDVKKSAVDFNTWRLERTVVKGRTTGKRCNRQKKDNNITGWVCHTQISGEGRHQ